MRSSVSDSSCDPSSSDARASVVSSFARTVALFAGAAILGLFAFGVLTTAILTALLNEISIIPDDFALVLDEYHAVDSKQLGVRPDSGVCNFVLKRVASKAKKG